MELEYILAKLIGNSNSQEHFQDALASYSGVAPKLSPAARTRILKLADERFFEINKLERERLGLLRDVSFGKFTVSPTDKEPETLKELMDTLSVRTVATGN